MIQNRKQTEPLITLVSILGYVRFSGIVSTELHIPNNTSVFLMKAGSLTTSS